MRPWAIHRLVVGGLLLMVFGGACQVDDGAGSVSRTGETLPEPFEPAPLEWQECGEKECATLVLPMDHSSSNGPTIEVAVARIRAVVEPRIGVLILNPGGPGGSGIEMLDWMGPWLADPMFLGRFDLVGFDPRGVGQSTPARCMNSHDGGIAVLGTGEGLDVAVGFAEERVAGCLEHSGDFVHHVGTNAVARDIDMIRRAMGEEQISYLGYSYGTRLGAVYAALFGDRVRAMVLDGPVDPNERVSRPSRVQADGFEASWTDFAEACDAEPACPLHAIGGPEQAFADAVAVVSAAPVPAGERSLAIGDFYLGVVAGLYSPLSWSMLGEGLEEVVADGTGMVLQDLGDVLVGRQDDGSYDGSVDALFLVGCADDPERPPPGEVFDATVAIADTLAHFGPAFTGSVGCYPLPTAVDPLHVGPAELAVPALVVHLEGDPATPSIWAGALADVLVDVVVISSDAEGHGAYMANSWCLTGPVTDYLVDLVVPTDGWSCIEPD